MPMGKKASKPMNAIAYRRLGPENSEVYVNMDAYPSARAKKNSRRRPRKYYEDNRDE
ncbi:hypothetical protein [Hyperthermus butylicus]|uniref:hypothetical protein n=1 Tax=Hyperthermus butylicus TaxID=54248 RepID=UPI00129A1AA0|nr:hypothetical protein [Hyperthermus butylicus]